MDKKSHLWLFLCLSTSTSHIYITSFLRVVIHDTTGTTSSIDLLLELESKHCQDGATEIIDVKEGFAIWAENNKTKTQQKNNQTTKQPNNQTTKQTNKQTNKQTTRKRARIVSFHSTLSWPQSYHYYRPINYQSLKKLQRHRIKPTKLSESIEIMQPHRSRNLKSSSQ